MWDAILPVEEKPQKWYRPTWTMYHLNESPRGVEAAAGAGAGAV